MCRFETLCGPPCQYVPSTCTYLLYIPGSLGVQPIRTLYAAVQRTSKTSQHCTPESTLLTGPLLKAEIRFCLKSYAIGCIPGTTSLLQSWPSRARARALTDQLPAVDYSSHVFLKGQHTITLSQWCSILQLQQTIIVVWTIPYDNLREGCSYFWSAVDTIQKFHQCNR